MAIFNASGAYDVTYVICSYVLNLKWSGYEQNSPSFHSTSHFAWYRDETSLL